MKTINQPVPEETPTASEMLGLFSLFKDPLSIGLEREGLLVG